MEQRQILALLSERDYPHVSFAPYGLPAAAADRRQLLSQ